MNQIKTTTESVDPYIYGATLRNVSAYGETRQKAKTALIAKIRDSHITCDNCGAYIHVCDCKKFQNNNERNG